MNKYAPLWLLLASILIALIPMGMHFVGTTAASMMGCHMQVNSIDYAPPVQPNDCPAWVNVFGGASYLFYVFTIPVGVLLFIASGIWLMVQGAMSKAPKK